ncbi:MAG: ROK family protein [Deltaproteobacteria bacterium]|nr:ROK family protein [Deltaproteobacteria bacterium]
MTEGTKKSSSSTPNKTTSDIASKLNGLQGWAIGVDLGGQSIRGAWVSTKGQIFDPIKWETKVSDGKEKVLSRLVQLVDELLKNPPPGCEPSKDLLGVGFGIPGIIHLKKGLVIQSPQFPDWKRFAVYEKLRKKIKFPVFIDNDANAAALGEKMYGVCKPYDHFVYVTLGSGIGGALFLNGDLYHGSMGLAGEIGHMTVDPQGAPESTGNRGSVELYASGSGFQKILSDLRERHPSISANTPEELYELWKRGNKLPEWEAVEKVFDDMGNALGIMLANVVNTLDPQAICFAGGLTHAWKAFSRKMIQITMERSYVARHNKLRILSTSLMKNSNFIEAGVVGAASLVFVDALKKQASIEIKTVKAPVAAAAPALKAVASVAI